MAQPEMLLFVKVLNNDVIKASKRQITYLKIHVPAACLSNVVRKSFGDEIWATHLNNNLGTLLWFISNGNSGFGRCIITALGWFCGFAL